MPFWLVLALLAALSAGGVYVLTVEGAGLLALSFLLLPGALGAWYLAATRPVPPSSEERSVDSPAEESEPFDDPVELADRVDRGEVVAEEPGSLTAPTPSPDPPRTP